MRSHGRPTLAARNTAMIEASAERLPIVVSDLFGIQPGTVLAWVKLARVNWINYQASCQPIE